MDEAKDTRRILIIDDNKDFADVLGLSLTALGHTVDISYDGYSGIEKSAQLQPDIILCDIGLTGMNGYEVSKEIKKLPSLNNTRLIALTGYTNAESKALEAGFDLFVTKPVDSASLQSILL